MTPDIATQPAMTPSGWRAGLIEAYLGLAEAAYRSGRPSGAEACLDRAAHLAAENDVTLAVMLEAL